MRSNNDLDEDELHAAASGLAYKVGGQGDEGTVKIGGKDYKLDISKPNPKEKATIKMIYQKDVVIPPTKDDGTGDPVDVAKGYTRITFDPTDKAQNPTKTYYDVKSTLTWAQAKAATPAVAEPTDPTPKDEKMNFIAWKDNEGKGQKLSEKTGTDTVAETTFKATYSDDVVPQPGNDKPDVPANFVLVKFLPGDHGTLSGTTKYWVNPTKEVTVPAPTVTANDGWKQKTGANAWNKPLKAIFATPTEITAQYEAKPVVIIPEDQDNPGNVPDGYARVTFKPGEGTFGATDKKVFDVLKGKTIQDAQKADPALAIPTATATDANKEHTGWTAASKDYKKDLKDYKEALNANVDFTAKYTDKKVVIIPEDQDNPGNVPDGYVRVTFKPGEGKFGANDKKVFDVLKGKTIQEAQAANPALTIPTATATDAKKEHTGWTADSKDYKKDLKDYTTALNGNVDFTAKYTDKAAPATDADKLTPAYKDAVGKAGTSVTTDAPTFTDADGKATIAPDGTKYTLGDKAPKGATIDEDNGKVTYTPSEAEAGKPVEIPVVVTYPDQSTDNATAKINVEALPDVIDRTGDENKPTPAGYVRVTFTNGEGVNDIANNKVYDVKEGKSLTEAQYPSVTAKEGYGTPVWSVAAGTAITKDTQLPITATAPKVGQTATPTITAPKAGDKTISGTSEPKAKVVVELPDGTKIETTADKDGKWKVDVPEGKEPKEGQTIKAVATVDGKTPSEEATVTVKGKDTGGTWFIPWTPTTSSVEKPKHETAIHKLYIYGYEDSTFRPEGNMTRAEAAAMLARLQGLDLSNSARPNFIDVRSGWYNAAINAVVNAGYMKGYPDGTFRPNGKITRAEFAQMIKAIDKANTGMAPFADAKGHWAEAAINQAYANERITGYPDGTFRPNNHITRAEAVTVFNKLYDRCVGEPGLADVKGRLVEFNDINHSHWAYFQVVESSNTHEFYRTEKGKVDETWVRVLQTWKEALANR